MEWQKLSYITKEFYAIPEKYPLGCVLVYNSVSPNVRLFSPQTCCIFVCEHVCMFALNTK